jgi:hypothetical protein
MRKRIYFDPAFFQLWTLPGLLFSARCFSQIVTWVPTSTTRPVGIWK